MGTYDLYIKRAFFFSLFYATSTSVTFEQWFCFFVFFACTVLSGVRISLHGFLTVPGNRLCHLLEFSFSFAPLMAIWWYYWSQIIFAATSVFLFVFMFIFCFWFFSMYELVTQICFYIRPPGWHLFLVDTGIFRSMMVNLEFWFCQWLYCCFLQKCRQPLTVHTQGTYSQMWEAVQRFNVGDWHAVKWNCTFSLYFVACSCEGFSADMTMKVLHWHLSPSGSALLCSHGLKLTLVTSSLDPESMCHVCIHYACCLKHWVPCTEVDEL